MASPFTNTPTLEASLSIVDSTSATVTPSPSTSAAAGSSVAKQGMLVPRRLVLCCDGSWQDALSQGYSNPSNVTRIARAIKPVTESGISQIVYYRNGVGTGDIGFLKRITGGAFGDGIVDQIQDAYCFFAYNYQPGDELFFFGFSRGSYMVRSVCAFILEFGLLTKAGMAQFIRLFDMYMNNTKTDRIQLGKEKKRLIKNGVLIDPVNAKEGPKLSAKFIGCFDTVGALGIPRFFSWQKYRYQFLNLQLSECIAFCLACLPCNSLLNLVSDVENACHALALDETRYSFTPTLWFYPKEVHNPDHPTAEKLYTVPNFKQVWFTGAHVNIGGGQMNDAEMGSNLFAEGMMNTNLAADGKKENPNTLSDGTLIWMVANAKDFLEFDVDYLHVNIRAARVEKDGAATDGEHPEDLDKLDDLTEGTEQPFYKGPICNNYGGLFGRLWYILSLHVRTPTRYRDTAGRNDSRIYAAGRFVMRHSKTLWDDITFRWHPFTGQGPDPSMLTNERLHQSVLDRARLPNAQPHKSLKHVELETEPYSQFETEFWTDERQI
ncbi:uncharacterized protein V1518DRAFT_407141 [Limtongia smithiae]|uniref:uncharacterized protein n=1 Tax=Limtongia smithiae TaxID=1125753 RepID=UPI0034CD9716